MKVYLIFSFVRVESPLWYKSCCWQPVWIGELQGVNSLPNVVETDRKISRLKISATHTHYGWICQKPAINYDHLFYWHFLHHLCFILVLRYFYIPIAKFDSKKIFVKMFWKYVYHCAFGWLDNVSCCGTFGLNTLWWFYFGGHHKLHWMFNLISCVK